MDFKIWKTTHGTSYSINQVFYKVLMNWTSIYKNTFMILETSLLVNWTSIRKNPFMILEISNMDNFFIRFLPVFLADKFSRIFILICPPCWGAFFDLCCVYEIMHFGFNSSVAQYLNLNHVIFLCHRKFDWNDSHLKRFLFF